MKYERTPESVARAIVLRVERQPDDAVRDVTNVLDEWLRQELNNEFSDIEMLCNHLSITYEHFSGGRVSKPLTLPGEVFRIAEATEQERLDDATNEALEFAAKRAEQYHEWRKPDVERRDGPQDIAEAIRKLKV